MKNKIHLTSLLILVTAGQLFAQFSFTPSKPLPGDVIKFTYNPPAKVFNTTDTITCTCFKWGLYEDDYAFESGAFYQPTVVKMYRNGDRYEGTVKTDTLTKALTLNFTSGDVKFKRVENNNVLVKGKVDKNDSLGYFILFYNVAGTECRSSNYFVAYYLISNYLNQIGITNEKKATQLFIRELELYPDTRKVWSMLSVVMRKSDPEGFKTMATNELNKIFEKGLTTESDYSLVTNLTSQLKLKGISKYFSDISTDKYKESGGPINLKEIYGKFAAERDINKKEVLMNDFVKCFDKLSYDDKLNLVMSSGLPRTIKSPILISLIQNDRVDDFQKYSQKYNISKETAPYLDYFYVKVLDTLLVRNKFPEYTEKEALSLLAFYKERLTFLNQGMPLPAIADEAYLTPAMQKEKALSSIVLFSGFCATMYEKAGNYKKALSYSNDALRYMQMLSNASLKAPEMNTQYSLLAEKVLPQKECKAEVEKLVASGFWKPEMIEVLKRIYIIENKAESGFDEYIKALKKSQMEELKKSLVASILNEPAPEFTLTDLEGKQVSLESLKGKTVILDFWATWCGPCKASFPAMKKLIDANKNNPDVKILFVDTFERFKDEKENRDKVVEFMKTNNYPFQVIYDFKNKVSADYKVTGIPTKCIIDKNGNLRYRLVGAELNESKLIDEMNAMLESIN